MKVLQLMNIYAEVNNVTIPDSKDGSYSYSPCLTWNRPHCCKSIIILSIPNHTANTAIDCLYSAWKGTDIP